MKEPRSNEIWRNPSKKNIFLQIFWIIWLFCRFPKVIFSGNKTHILITKRGQNWNLRHFYLKIVHTSISFLLFLEKQRFIYILLEGVRIMFFRRILRGILHVKYLKSIPEKTTHVCFFSVGWFHFNCELSKQLDLRMKIDEGCFETRLLTLSNLWQTKELQKAWISFFASLKNLKKHEFHFTVKA